MDRHSSNLYCSRINCTSKNIYTLISWHQVLETKILEGLNTESTFKFLLVEKPWVEKRTCQVAAAADKSSQLCPTLSDPMDCSLPGSSVHGIFQARVLEWGAIAFSNPSSLPSFKYFRVLSFHLFSESSVINWEPSGRRKGSPFLKLLKTSVTFWVFFYSQDVVV